MSKNDDNTHDLEPLPSHGLIGAERWLNRVLDFVRNAVEIGAVLLLIGGPGTGKELFAQHAHDSSERADKPFIVVDCTIIPDTLAPSELLGHVRGTFTDAKESRVGLVEQANGGTIVFDEIGDLSPAGQAALLPVLEKKQIRRVGSRTVQTVDLQIIAATNQDLHQLVKEGRFRRDLLDRIDQATIRLPSLKERVGDIPALVRHFIGADTVIQARKIRSISEDALDVLMRHDWPGNVRELRNLLVRASLLADGDRIDAEHINAALAMHGVHVVIGAALVVEVAREILQRERHVHLATVVALTKTPETSARRAMDALAAKGQLEVAIVERRRVYFIVEDRGGAHCPGCAVLRPTDTVAHAGGEDDDGKAKVPAAAVPSAWTKVRHRRRGGKARSHGLAELERTALELAGDGDLLTRKMLVEASGATKHVASKALCAMAKKGLLRFNGRKGRGAGYVLPG